MHPTNISNNTQNVDGSTNNDDHSISSTREYDPSDIFYQFLLDDDDDDDETTENHHHHHDDDGGPYSRRNADPEETLDHVVRSVHNGMRHVSLGDDIPHQQQEKDKSVDQITTNESHNNVGSVLQQPPQPQNDIVCDLDGQPLTVQYLASKMGIQEPPYKVHGYICPDEHTFRGFMSNGCRIQLVVSSSLESEPSSLISSSSSSATEQSPPLQQQQQRTQTQTQTQTTEVSSSSIVAPTAFYKRIEFQTLGHALEKFKTAPFKLRRDSRSYQVVADFLSSVACQQLTSVTGIQIPKLLDADLRPCHDNPVQSKFSFLLEDYSPSNGWYQQWLLHGHAEVYATLTTYAKLHAFFWTGSSFWKQQQQISSSTTRSPQQELVDAVWPSGSYVQPHAQDPNQCFIVDQEWKTKRMKFQSVLKKYDYWDNLGKRLQSVAVECGHHAHPFAEAEHDNNGDNSNYRSKDQSYNMSKQYEPFKTFTHGDPKQANILFRRRRQRQQFVTPDQTSVDIDIIDDEDQQQQSNDTDDVQVGLIDFQWSGFGLAATDIAHLFTSAIHADMLVNGGEEMLLRYYFDTLQRYLVEYGAYDSPDEAQKQYSYITFVEQYETAVLDIVRLVITYTWSRFEIPVTNDDDDETKAKTMNKTSYNKSIPNIVWLMSKCDDILKKRGVY